MKDDKRNPQDENSKQLRKVSSKRWFYPAIYLCVAALVMSGVLWMENGINKDTKNNAGSKISQNQTAQNPTSNDAVPVNTQSKETLHWPVSDQNAVSVGQKFFDASASQDEQVAALVNYDNTYAPNTGINLVAKDKKSFDVTAAVSGTVTRAEQDPLLGYVIEVKHDNGVTTLYESLASVTVQQGDQVTQGQLLGQAGSDKYNKAMGVHLHFEVRKDNIPVNPVAFWNKSTAAVTITKSTPSASTSSNPSAKNDPSASSDSNSSSDNQTKSKSDNNMNDQSQGSSNMGSTSSDKGTSN